MSNKDDDKKPDSKHSEDDEKKRRDKLSLATNVLDIIRSLVR